MIDPTLSPRGKWLEEKAIVCRIYQELTDIQAALERDRDADQIRGKLSATKTILADIDSDLEARI